MYKKAKLHYQEMLKGDGVYLEGHKPDNNINCNKKAYLNGKAQTGAFHKQWS